MRSPCLYVYSPPLISNIPSSLPFRRTSYFWESTKRTVDATVYNQTHDQTAIHCNPSPPRSSVMQWHQYAISTSRVSFFPCVCYVRIYIANRYTLVVVYNVHMIVCVRNGADGEHSTRQQYELHLKTFIRTKHTTATTKKRVVGGLEWHRPWMVNRCKRIGDEPINKEFCRYVSFFHREEHHIFQRGKKIQSTNPV